MVPIYISDLPFISIHQDDNSVQEDLQNINNWLIAKKLKLNMDKTVQMIMWNKNSASKLVFRFDEVFNEVRNLCKYLVIYVDSQLCF